VVRPCQVLALSVALRARFFVAGKTSYSAASATDLISALCTGTHLDIAATDQIRPIATTVAIAIIPARILLPLCVALIWAQ
jgi:hypothetical protein